MEVSKSKKSFVVYTVSLGAVAHNTSITNIKDPTVVNPNVDYIAFTDKPTTSKVWTVINTKVDRMSMADGSTQEDTARQCRQYKLLPHKCIPHATSSLWIDSVFRLNCDPIALASEYLTDCDMATFKSGYNSSIEEEAELIGKARKGNVSVCRAQAAVYREAGFEKKDLVTCTGFMLRRHTPQLAAFGEVWWDQLTKYSARDQMSVDFAAYMTDLDIAYFPGTALTNKYAGRV